MAAGADLRVEQLALNADLKPAPIGWDKAYAGQVGFEVLEQFHRQTDGAVGVVSNGAVDDLNVDHGRLRDTD